MNKKTREKVRGDGTLYRRGRIFWLQYCVDGKVLRESSHSDDETEAQKMLNRRLKKLSPGQVIEANAERVTLADMRQSLLTDYKLEGNRSLKTAEYFANNILGFFGPTTKALRITKDRIDEFILSLKEHVLSGATINRHTSCLHHMFMLMVEAKRLSHDHVPTITRLPEAPPREGYVEPAEFAKLYDSLPEYLREPTWFAYLVGWRKGAFRTLEWERDVELEFKGEQIIGGSITLQPQYSKNKQRSKPLPIVGDILEVIRSAWAKRVESCAYVFHRGGKPIGDFRKAWKTALRTAGIREDLYVHDMRRSAVRNLSRGGKVDETVIMSITGHLTRSMLTRYNIVSGADLAAALTSVSDYNAKRVAEPMRAPAKVLPLVRKSA